MSNIKRINWGIIGCGDVTELKSGPAFNKVPDSALVAVMRRDAAKARDYAQRHNVPCWYSDADKLINDPEVNAIYVATPPVFHEEYSIAAINAGKPVYVEKPMAMNYSQALNMAALAAEKNVKMVVAHYRREQPFFNKIKELIEGKIIGDIRIANLTYYRNPFKAEELTGRNLWRVDPAVAGGGIFHDLAPHQLDLMLYFFGEVEKVHGMATNQAGIYKADDMVTGSILFKNGIAFNGSWCFNCAVYKDHCEIIGTAGKISFNVFDNRTIELTVNGNTSEIVFEKLQHVQQPMIAKTVQYFLGNAENPGTAANGAEVMRLIGEMVIK
jgi:predicted dehydrogenase